MIQTIKNTNNLNDTNKIKYYNKRSIQCLNCGYKGHTIKTCNYPITSYGIICYYINNGNIKYLMIQRKDSLCYCEFIRGRYKMNDLNYICNLFKYLTPLEKNNIMNNNFDTLWKILWKHYDINKFKKEYALSKNKFNKIKNGFFLNNQFIDFNYILTRSINNKINYHDTEWEFPKGRRDLYENNINCAIREFQEESGLSKNNIELINNKSYEEIYIAVNNIRYRHIYYIAKCKNLNNICNLFNSNNKTQIKEVKDVQWYQYDDIIKKIRDIYIERIELFKRIDKIVQKYEFNIS
jgi:8-oxo-dGTP pyrophosphatase MutT (NUDIX family)